MPTTWRLTIEYDGRAFSGFQRQAHHRSIQQDLEEALSTFFGGERIIVHGSGRTDAGVHALGQVVSFRAETPRDPNRLRLGMNTLLQRDLSVIEASMVPPGFHARMSAVGKTYRYVVLDRRDRSPFHEGRAWYLRESPDWARVDDALRLLRGTHDFSGFRSSSCTMARTTRTLARAERTAHGTEHHLEFEGPGFLRYQVRIMVGTVIDVGLGRCTLDEVSLALATGRREHAGRTAPPGGLYLVKVHYRDATAGDASPVSEGSAEDED
jgi:tRNA pseudouridine38-40 synthase